MTTAETLPFNGKRLLSVKDFCAIYSVGRTTVFAEIKTGRLQAVKVCGLRRIRAEDGEAWLANRLKEEVA